jgi:UDP-N-acetylglucosamine--N-acetylmuramyl-(pentapeptide) pyrophosphoryl-undecaprenol N-acetylglucosamine transferase
MAAYQSILDADVYFIGCQHGYESRIVPGRGFPLEVLPGAPFMREGVAGKARSVGTILRGTVSARRLLRARGTRLVIGLGSYGSVGAVLAARTLGIPTVIHEANAVPGIANRLLGRIVDRVLVSWDCTRAAFPSAHVAVTGTPVLHEIAGSALAPASLPGGSRSTVLVCGGSEGSPFLNRNAPSLLAKVRALGIDLEVHHLTGYGAVEPVRALYEQAGIPAQVDPFLDNMARCYTAAHFVISAPGAITLAELAAIGRPSLLVPSSVVANDHQTANAVAYTSRTGDLWCSEREWAADTLAVRVAELLGDREKLEAQARRTRAAAVPDAAQSILDECESLMQGRW